MQMIPVMRLMRTASFRFLLVLLLLPALASSHMLGQSQQQRQLDFHGKHRVVAHGNEFNGLAISSDRQRLFVATEKAEVIVWNIGAGRVEQPLRQSGPVHLIAALADADEFVAAGSNHFEPRNAEVRKWNANTRASVELQGVDKSSFPVALDAEIGRASCRERV